MVKVYRRFGLIFVCIIAVALLVNGILSSMAFGEKASLEFVFLGAAEETKVWEGLVSDFMEQNPDITVKITPVPAESWGEYFDKISVMIAGGTPPDVARIAIEGA